MKKYKKIYMGILVSLVMALSFSVSVLATEPDGNDGDTGVETEESESSDGDNGANDGPNISDPVTVTGVSLSKSSLTMVEGQTATLTVTVEPDNADNQEVTWDYDDSVITVKNGKVTALAAGSTTITVTSQDNGKSAECKVTVSKYTDGFHQDPDSGDWYYYTNKKVATDKTDVMKGEVNGKTGWWNVINGKLTKSVTVAQNSNGWWYINSNGMVDFSYNGFAKNSNGSWYCENGQVLFNKNSVLKDTVGAIGTKGDWYYVVGSKVQTGYTGVANYKNSNGWWYVKNGKVDFTANTVAKNNNGWWYVNGGKVNFSYNGFGSNSNGKWYLESGKVTFTKNSVIKDSTGALGSKGDWYYVVGSKVQTGYTGVANYKNSNGWWYIKDGKVDFSANTVAKNNNGWWYVKDGKVNFSYNGFGSNSNGKWYIESGTVTFKKNSVIKDATGAIGSKGTWYYVVGSKVQTSYTGVSNYKNENGWWYIKDGKVDFSFNGLAENKNGWWVVKDGKVDLSHTISIETSMAKQALTLVNQERANYGVSALSMPSIHQTMATQRAYELSINCSHYRPDGTLCSTILSEYGVTTNTVGENIAYGYTSAAQVVNAWMNSEGHRANILDSDYSNIGIACVKVDGVYYWEQLFTGAYSQK